MDWANSVGRRYEDVAVSLGSDFPIEGFENTSFDLGHDPIGISPVSPIVF